MVAVVWLFLVSRLKLSSPWLSLAVVVTFTWSCFLFIRIDGGDSRLRFETHWRWTPTFEEQFLAQSKLVSPGANLSKTNAAIIADPSRGDWTSFRGAERDGVIRGTSIATNWSGTSPMPVWKHGVGPAWSSDGQFIVFEKHRAAPQAPGD